MITNSPLRQNIYSTRKKKKEGNNCFESFRVFECFPQLFWLWISWWSFIFRSPLLPNTSIVPLVLILPYLLQSIYLRSAMQFTSFSFQIPVQSQGCLCSTSFLFFFFLSYILTTNCSLSSLNYTKLYYQRSSFW